MRAVCAAPGFDTPTQDNLEALFDVMLGFARHYLEIYYPHAAQGKGHEGLRDDTALVAWLGELNAAVPNGVGVSAADVDLGQSGAAAGAHPVPGLGAARDPSAASCGTTSFGRTASRHACTREFQPEPLDVYQRLVNANYNLNVHRRALMDDFSYLALDDMGAAAMRRFCQQLETLQATMAHEPWAVWKLYPRVLKVNINA